MPEVSFSFFPSFIRASASLDLNQENDINIGSEKKTTKKKQEENKPNSSINSRTVTEKKVQNERRAMSFQVYVYMACVSGPLPIWLMFPFSTTIPFA